MKHILSLLLVLSLSAVALCLASCPLCMKITSERQLRWIQELIHDVLAGKNLLKKGGAVREGIR